MRSASTSCSSGSRILPAARSKTVDEFASLLTGENAPLLVGGQAVNAWAVWALQYSGDPQLKRLQPFTSKDCDVLGDAALLRKLSKRSGLPAKIFKFGQASFCVGYLHAKEAPDEPFLEVLSGLNGLTKRDLEQGEARLSFEGVVYRTLSPLTLLKAKIANAHDLPQEDRQDVRHVQMLVICVRSYISMMLSPPANESENKQQSLNVKRALGRLKEIIESDQARAVSGKYGIDFQQCFPMDDLKASPLPAAQNFCKYQLK